MSEFLTVKEAARLVGKSTSSIRRVIYPIIRNDNHSDRNHIKPSAEEALILRTRGESFPWRLSEDLLRREVPIGAPSENPTASPPHRGPSSEDGALLEMLRRELDIKNQQIAQQLGLINALSERLREGNILIGSLSQRLALTEGKRDIPIEAQNSTAVSPEEGSRVTTTRAPRRGLFARIFS